MERLLMRSLVRSCRCWWSVGRISSPVSHGITRRKLSTESQSESDKPISYTKSKAYQYRASESFRISQEEKSYPSYTPYIIKGSFLIFLIYFCILRESNDIDELLTKDLFEVMPDLEIPMLEAEIKRFEANGLNTAKLKQKVEEIKQLKETKKQLTGK